MQVAAPYLMTFKNPTNSYFDVGEGQIPRALIPSDFRKRKRDELLQRAVSEGTFDFDERPVPPTSGGMYNQRWIGAGGSGTQNEVFDVLDIDEDNVEPMEIPIANVLSSAKKLGDMEGSGSIPQTSNAAENQIVLVSDSDE